MWDESCDRGDRVYKATKGQRRPPTKLKGTPFSFVVGAGRGTPSIIEDEAVGVRPPFGRGKLAGNAFACMTGKPPVGRGKPPLR